MTDVVAPATPVTSRRTPAIAVLARGLFGGFALGVAARAWMRLISDDPEFTWGGTLFIVLGVTFFATMQSVVAVVRIRARRRWVRGVVRGLGIAAMLPLFMAAGGIMFPTVIGGGLAHARTGWNRWVRALLLVIALAPVVLVTTMIQGDFGWTLHTLAGVLSMIGVYSVIVWATQFSFAPRPAVGDDLS